MSLLLPVGTLRVHGQGPSLEESILHTELPESGLYEHIRKFVSKLPSRCRSFPLLRIHLPPWMRSVTEWPVSLRLFSEVLSRGDMVENEGNSPGMTTVAPF